MISLDEAIRHIEEDVLPRIWLVWNTSNTGAKN